MANSTIGQIMSDEEIGNVARQMLQPGYNASKTGVENQYKSGVLALDQGLETYMAGVEGAQKQTEQMVMDSAIKRGMGRSSRTTYELSEGLAGIAEQVGLYTKQIEEQKNALSQNRSSTLAQLAGDYETQVMSNIYQLRQQQLEQYRWQKEYDLALNNSKSGSGSSGNSNNGLTDMAALLAVSKAGQSTQPTYSASNQAKAVSTMFKNYKTPAKKTTTKSRTQTLRDLGLY